MNDSPHGSTSVTVAPGGKTLTIHAEADGHIAIEAGWDVCVDCPDELQKWAGSARRQVQVQLRSDEPTKKTGTQTQLLITTRGLCCCDDAPNLSKGIIDAVDIPPSLGGVARETPMVSRQVDIALSGEAPLSTAPGASAVPDVTAPCCEDCARAAEAEAGGTAAGRPGPIVPLVERQLSIRQANAIGDFVKERMVNVRRGPTALEKPVPFVYSDPFLRQLAQVARRSRVGRELLDQPAANVVPPEVLAPVAKRLGTEAGAVTARDLVSFRTKDLVRMSGADPVELGRFRLQLLGVPVRGHEYERPGEQSA